jgi:hypothetical protein
MTLLFGRTQLAQSTPFEPNRNPQYGGNAGPSGIASLEVQSAIEEVKAIVASIARFAMVFVANGTVGNNNWLGFNELVTSQTTPMIIPVNCVLKEMAFSFSGAAVDGVLLIYKNGLVNPTNVIYSNTFTNVNTYKLMSNINIPLAQGDRIAAQWQDTGDNPSDAALQFFFQTT